MIPVQSGVRVWLAVGHTDMRRGMNSLALQVQEKLGRDPHAGDLFGLEGNEDSKRHSAYGFRFATITYRGHPLFGRTFRVSLFRRGKGLTCIYTDERPDLCRELPNWMFDQGYCAGMTLGPPEISIEGLNGSTSLPSPSPCSTGIETGVHNPALRSRRRSAVRNNGTRVRGQLVLELQRHDQLISQRGQQRSRRGWSRLWPISCSRRWEWNSQQKRRPGEAPMSGKITPDHLDRAAVGYVRQSTMAQVIGNLESQRRQYHLAGPRSRRALPP
jgi:IS66 Orf2 like protein